MILWPFLLACSAPTPGPDPGVVDDTGPDDTGPGDTGPDDTGSSVAPPAWWTDAARFSVAPDRGLAFTVDESWVLAGFTVPVVFRTPDGRYALSATDMRGGDQFVKRSVLYSDDAVTWGEPSVLIGPDAFPSACGNRLEDGAPWPTGPGSMRFVAECATVAEGGMSTNRSFWAAETTDLQAFEVAEAPLWTGYEGAGTISVPSILPLDDGDALLLYNGDIYDTTAAGAGIRVARIDGETLAVTPVDEARILPRENVDPQVVFLDGGGVRLYHTSVAGSTGGIAYTPLTADGRTTAGETTFLFQSSGQCGRDSLGECYMDPTFVRTEDGAMYLYFTALTMEADGFVATVKRARATD